MNFNGVMKHLEDLSSIAAQEWVHRLYPPRSLKVCFPKTTSADGMCSQGKALKTRKEVSWSPLPHKIHKFIVDGLAKGKPRPADLELCHLTVRALSS